MTPWIGRPNPASGTEPAPKKGLIADALTWLKTAVRKRLSMRPARGHLVSQCKAANSSTRFNTFPLPQISHSPGWLILGAIRQVSELADTLRHRSRTSVHLTSSYLTVDWVRHP